LTNARFLRSNSAAILTFSSSTRFLESANNVYYLPNTSITLHTSLSLLPE
jgi:hypothetical protein